MSEPVDETTISAADVLTAVEDVKREIRTDFENGVLGDYPPRSFSILHDWVDANTYGDFAEPHRFRAAWPIPVKNLVQCAVDSWLIEGAWLADAERGIEVVD